MLKLFVTRPLPEKVLEALKGRFDMTVRSSELPMSFDEMTASLRDYDVVLPTLRDLYSAEVFSAVDAPRCRLLANFGVGFNHIDVGAARAAGVLVTNTPGAVTDATADIALTLMLMVTRRAGEGERLVRSGGWTGWHPTQMLGMHLTGKRVGILGMGRIGQAIARRCHYGFDMSVHYFSRSPKEAVMETSWHPTAAELAAAVDVLVVAVPGGAETRHLVDADVLKALGPKGYLVNIARGDVVDEAALIAALEAVEIAGAGLDVYEYEPEVPEALIARPNVVLLPHLGTAALEVREAMGMVAVANLVAFAEGRELLNPV
ncbi:D-glycerate dehydrogenase [Donghicola sp. C2-DW-16]|uniref:D-glycerate dehydrogenase n=1 Tax=Donghicola mangrovi TaxID=2729614 RepID=A0ABX2PGE5_9RHOB|nr:D-glycerate dehydrogenase [Donghicola mangrovi]NVO28265.1 D-glycerate dehydrogenase [Donghicola mangrovi]